MTSAPSRGETDDQSLSLRSATPLQLQTFRVICQPQAVEEDVIQRTSFSGASVRLTCGRHRRPPGTMPDVAYPSMTGQADRATNDE